MSIVYWKLSRPYDAQKLGLDYYGDDDGAADDIGYCVDGDGSEGFVDPQCHSVHLIAVVADDDGDDDVHHSLTDDCDDATNSVDVADPKKNEIGADVGGQVRPLELMLDEMSNPIEK